MAFQHKGRKRDRDLVEDRQKVETPPYIITYLRKTYGDEKGYLRDLCPIDYIKGESVDSLKIDWDSKGKWMFLNPPYKKVLPWFEKAVCDCKKFGTNFIFLCPFASQTQCSQKVVFKNAHKIHAIEGYVSFVGWDGDEMATPLCLVEFCYESLFVNRNSNCDYIRLYPLKIEGKPKAIKKNKKISVS